MMPNTPDTHQRVSFLASSAREWRFVAVWIKVAISALARGVRDTRAFWASDSASYSSFDSNRPVSTSYDFGCCRRQTRDAFSRPESSRKNSGCPVKTDFSALLRHQLPEMRSDQPAKSSL